MKLINPTHYGLSQSFGENKVSFYKELGMKGHNGLDYSTGYGALILAPCDMTIVYIVKEDKDKGYGNSIWAEVIDGDIRYEMVFAHLSKFIKTKGKVKMGEPIGYTGNTGKYTTGPHLHWGVRPWNVGGNVIDFDNGYLGYIDPTPYILKSFQNEPIRLFKGKEYNGSAFYMLGLKSEYIEVSDAKIIKSLIGDWKDIEWSNITVDLPPDPSRKVFMSLTKFKEVYGN